MPVNPKDQFRSLAVDQIHVWHGSVEQIVQTVSDTDLRAVLSPPELETLTELSRKNVRDQYLATRILIRNLLSLYRSDCAPADWLFIKNEFGKPCVDAKIGSHQLQFNISHSNGLVVLAFGLDVPVGVDVEFRQREPSLLRMTGEIFSSEEARVLHQLSADKLSHRFFQYWTLKEAYIKAKGMGLSLPLAEFTFRFLAESQISIEFSDKIHDFPDQWQFRLFEVAKGYQCALAVKHAAEHPLAILQMGNFLNLAMSRAA